MTTAPHPPGSTVSACPLCGWEYEWPEAAVPAGVMATGKAADILVREVMLAWAARIEDDLGRHFADVHDAPTVEAVLALLQR